MEERTTSRLLVNVAVIIYFVTGECYGKLVKKPGNITVFEGQMTILECETDFHDLMHTVFWKFENEDIFYGGAISLQYTSKFGIRMDHTKGIFNLIITNATKFHNGRYTCADDEGEGEKSYAWVTVTESPSPQTTEANGNISASTGTNTLVITAIVISIIVALVAVIAAVIFIYRRIKSNRSKNVNVKSNSKLTGDDASPKDSKSALLSSLHGPIEKSGQKNGGELPKNVECSVQKQNNDDVTSTPSSTWRNDDGIDTSHYPNPNDIKKLLEANPNHTIPHFSMSYSDKHKNPEQREKKNLLEKVDESKQTTEIDFNAAPMNAAENVPLTSEDAKSNSKLTADDDNDDAGDFEYGLSKQSSSQIRT